MNLPVDIVTMKECDLKKILTEIKNGNKHWAEVNKVLIVKSMINHIGSTDSELRDQLIYTCFYRLIIESNQLEQEVLKELLETSLKDLLFKGIGENGTDTVFTRAFTSLLVALILYRDNKDNFLSQSKVYQIKERLIQYINDEEDLRGYVPNRGWAHSIAHVADTFDELVKSPKISQSDYPEILAALWNKMFVSNSVYVHQEEERVVTPVIVMLNSGLEAKEIENLLDNLPHKLKTQKEQLEPEKYWFLVFNMKTFLKSFYMKLNKDSKLESLQNSIDQCLLKI
ncbi:DUF2785 domain-containing protein [Bacillus sp. NEB1478]|uniref:DUF2785 domain-containing protein n=1 Tax=Bacillus sp. NEB1478 TaxID=3073816 RepID=UPI002873334E|nr:DUF2785 domain-containing protein [Bacillus sp. NEB1478]WNB92576.1 DUF2785 domain-containing protein [Bacillus sp. NEB1478]